MRRSIPAMLAGTFIIFSIAISQPEKAHAFGISIGPCLWFAWWKPAFEDTLVKTLDYGNYVLPRYKKDFYLNPTLMYGPAITLNFNDMISWSNVLVLGNYHLRSFVVEFLPSSITHPAFILSKPNIGIMKYDVDSILSFRLHRYLKLFWGLKYQHYTYSKVNIFIAPSMADVILFMPKDTFIYHGLSTGIGISMTFKLPKNFSIVLNISGLYQHPIILVKRNWGDYLIVSGSPVPFIQKKNVSKPQFNAVGANSTFSFGYTIESISTSIILGFRYQYVFMMGNNITNFTLNRKSDHFYGLTFSALYTYNSGAGKKDSEER